MCGLMSYAAVLIILSATYSSNVCDAIVSNEVEEGNFQLQLVDYLMAKYGTGIVRPVFNTSTVTTVIFRPKIHEVIELDARNQRITVSALLKQVWHDEFLHWNVSEYGGITKIQLPSDMIWVPDITLGRNIDSDFERIKNTRAAIQSDGRVTWYAPAIFTSSCRIKVRYFPFDTQICVLQYSSWAYNGFEVDLFPDKSNDSSQDSFLENGVWDLLEVHTEKVVNMYPCCPEPYPELEYALILKRRSTYYISYLILPCLFLSALSLLVFYLPAECGEKLTLAITNLLALVVFQQLVAESMPPSGEDPPLIGDYFLAMITMVCVSVVTTVFVLHVSSKSGSVPYWAQLLFLRYLARFTCMYHEEYDHSSSNLKLRDSSTVEISFKLLNADNKPDAEGIPDKNDVNQNGCQIPTAMADDLHFMRNDLEDKIMEENTTSQWKHIGRIVDRCLLVVFLVYTTMTSLILIIRAMGPAEHAH
ncbi:neuronal acetylcholine receptor subunit alpha-9-like [Amphiura filiformis]|uniref:neuronal acetylcholine receptor subunit alpha-9-like n=1 Tax=Amphiura filiformis TaxID=82378 RepID=UPI003B21215F